MGVSMSLTKALLEANEADRGLAGDPGGAAGAEGDRVTPDRLRAWSPSMAEYHANPAISSGLIAGHREGLSVALADRVRPRTVATAPPLVRGTILHAWISGDQTASVHVAPPTVTARRGAEWQRALERAQLGRADALALASDVAACCCAWASLWMPSEGHRRAWLDAAPPPMRAAVRRFCLAPWPDSGARSQLRAMLSRWRVWPEVSHRWAPPEVPGAVCRIRQDVIAEAPSGAVVALSLKTTTKPLGASSWWPFWSRAYRRPEAFYRVGLRDLFGARPFHQALAVVRLEPPYPWAIYSLEERAAELDETWSAEVVPAIREITEALGRGEMHGPEERGIEL